MRHAVSCCTGHNAFSDLIVERKQSLIRITIAATQSDLTPTDANQLIDVLVDLLIEMETP